MIEIIVEKFNKLIPHYYISHQQLEYLKDRKKNMIDDTAIVLFDFSENFSFVIQDEVEGHYYSRESCTLHPVVIYTKNEKNELENRSLSYLTSDLRHDVSAVNTFLKRTIEYIKSNFPNIKNLDIFSDGCAGQYKNCINFYNLCQVKRLFSINIKWSFFATSHGKSPCDGIGGVIK